MDAQMRTGEQAAPTVPARLFRAALLSVATLLFCYALIQFGAALLLAVYFSTLGYSPAESFFPQGAWLGAALRLWLCWSFPHPLSNLYASQLGCRPLLDVVEKTIQYSQMAEGPPFEAVLYYQLPTASPILAGAAALIVFLKSVLSKPRTS